MFVSVYFYDVRVRVCVGMSVWHRRWCCVAVLVLVAGSACVAGPLALRAPPGAPLHERLRLADRLLHDTPLVDGHNDLPWNIRKFLHNKIKDFRYLFTSSKFSPLSPSPKLLPRFNFILRSARRIV